MIKKIFLKIFIISFFVLTSNSFAVVMPVFKQSASVTDITGDDIGGPADVTLSPDGTKIHFTNFTNETGFAFIRQFTLTTPFDISTMDTSSEVRLNLNAGSDDVGSFIQGHEFNSDGTKVFVISQNGTFNIHTLTTPYDISTCYYVEDINPDTDALALGSTAVGDRADVTRNHVQGVEINPAGTKIFLTFNDASGTKDGLKEFTLSTPFDITTMSLVKSAGISLETASNDNPDAIFFGLYG